MDRQGVWRAMRICGIWVFIECPSFAFYTLFCLFLFEHCLQISFQHLILSLNRQRFILWEVWLWAFALGSFIKWNPKFYSAKRAIMLQVSFFHYYKANCQEIRLDALCKHFWVFRQYLESIFIFEQAEHFMLSVSSLLKFRFQKPLIP